MMAIGHNGGPPLSGLSRKAKDEIITKLVWHRDLTAAQKVIAIAVTMLSDATGEVQLGAEDLKIIAHVNKRDTVFEAKKALEDRGIIAKSTTEGKANRYRIVPQAVMDSIVENFHNYQSARKPVPKNGTTPLPGNGTGDVPKKETAPRPEKGDGPVPKNGASPTNRDGSRALTRAHLEPPSGVINPLDYNPEGEVSTKPPAPAREVPHMNGVGFVISTKHDLIIPVEVVNQWRARFPAIPDLEAQLEKLSAVILKGGHSHVAWTCPEGWLAGCLAQDNARALAANKPKPRKLSRFGC
jgi:hypothetical protein